MLENIACFFCVESGWTMKFSCYSGFQLQTQFQTGPPSRCDCSATAGDVEMKISEKISVKFYECLFFSHGTFEHLSFLISMANQKGTELFTFQTLLIEIIGLSAGINYSICFLLLMVKISVDN